MFIYTILTLVLTIQILIAFEISHLYAPTIDSIEDMNNNSNSEFTPISDDLIYLDIKQRQSEFTSTTQKSSELLKNNNIETKLTEETSESLTTISKFASINSIMTDDKIKDYSITTDDKIKDFIVVVEPPVENQEQQKDDSLIIATNYDDHKSRLTNDPNFEQDDCNTAEDDNNDEYINFNQINRPHIDLNDFIALIPVDKVQNIVREYYKNDIEVHRAYSYLQSQDFIELKMKIINIDEVNQFLRYLNHSGLDVLEFTNNLIKLCGDPEIIINKKNLENNNSKIENDEMKIIENSEEIRNSTNGMSGLQGLVDSILDILPQDQILTVFFEKLETDIEFSKFIQKIGSDMFSYLLKRNEDSIQLKNLVYTLHNNGIYISRIVDSLKDYFFLGL